MDKIAPSTVAYTENATPTQADIDPAAGSSVYGTNAVKHVQSPLRDHGETALDNGYIIVPVAPFEKRPSLMTARGDIKPMPDWQKLTRAKAEQQIELWKSWGPGWGFGILAGVSSAGEGGVLPIDIDVTDEAGVARIRDLTRDALGPTGIIRVGKPPKSMLMYRMNRCFQKIIVGKVELLGVGNQFIAGGYHPVTRGLYQYVGPDGALFDTHIDDLPHVDHKQFLEYIRSLAEDQFGAGSADVTRILRGVLNTLKKSGVTPESLAAVEDLYKVKSSAKEKTYAMALPTELSRIAELLEAIPNEGEAHWDFYGKEIIGAVHFETGGSAEGFELFSRWSRKNHRHDPDEDRKRWDNLTSSPMTGYKVGTLYHHAFAAGWQRPADERVSLEVEHAVRDVTGAVAVDLPEEVSIEEARRRTAAKGRHAGDFIKSPTVVQERLAHRAWLGLIDAQREFSKAKDYLSRLKSQKLQNFNALPDTREDAIRSALCRDNGLTDFNKLRQMTDKLAAMPDHGGFDLSAGLLSFDQAMQAYPIVYGAAPPNKQDKLAAAEKRLEDATAAAQKADGDLTVALLRAKIEGVEIEDPRVNSLSLMWPAGNVAVVFREPPSSGKSHAVNHSILADEDIRALVITSDHGGGGTKRLKEELQHLGDDFTILRGMTAENPDAAPRPDGTQPKMCAFAHTIPLVKAAGGTAGSMCGKPGSKRVCPKYETCAFVQQPLNKRVTVVAGADAVQFFPQIAAKADAIIYDDVAASRMQMVDDVDMSVVTAFRRMMPPEDAYHPGNYAMDRCVRFAQDFEALVEKALEANGRLSPSLIEQVMPTWVARGVIGQIAKSDWPSADELPEMLAEGWTPYLYCDCLDLIEVEDDLRRMVVPLHLLITPGGNPLAQVDPAITRWNAACIALADAAKTLTSTMTLVRRVARVVEGEDKVTLRTTRNIELPEYLDATPVLFLDGTAEVPLVKPVLGDRRMGLPPTIEERVGNEIGHAVETVRWREPFRIRPFDNVVVRKLAGTELTLGKLVPPNRSHFGDDDTTVDGRNTNAAFERAKITAANNREVLHRLSLRMRLFHGVSGTGLTAPKAVEPLLREIEGGLVERFGVGAGVLAQPVLWRQEYKARGDNSLSGVTGYISASRLGSQPVHYEDPASVAFGVWLELDDRHKLAPAHYPLRDGRVLEGSVAVNPDPLGEIYRRDLVRGSVGQNGVLRVRPGSAAGRAALEAWELQSEPSGLYAYDDVVTMPELRDWANDTMTAVATGLLPLTHAAEVLAGPAGVSVVTMRDRLKYTEGRERRDLDAAVEMYRRGLLPWQAASVWMVPVQGVEQPEMVVLSVLHGDVLAATRLLDAHRVPLSGVPTPVEHSEVAEAINRTTFDTRLTGGYGGETPYRESLLGVSPPHPPVKEGRVVNPSIFECDLPDGPWGESAALLAGTIFEKPARAGVFARPGTRGFNTLMAHLADVSPDTVKEALENPHLRAALESIMPEELSLTNAVASIKPEGLIRAVKLEVMLVHPASKAYLKAKDVGVTMTGSYACEVND